MRAPRTSLTRGVESLYNYFRHYNSAIGRFVESDPVGLLTGTNPYAYVGNDPLAWVDFLGLARGRGGRWDGFGGSFGQKGLGGIYTIKCGLNIVYVGMTNNFGRRYLEHSRGSGKFNQAKSLTQCQGCGGPRFQVHVVESDKTVRRNLERDLIEKWGGPLNIAGRGRGRR